MTIADDILDLLKRKRRLKLTAIDIAEMLYWEDKSYRPCVQADCSLLYEQGRLLRDGKGNRSTLTPIVLLQLSDDRHHRHDHQRANRRQQSAARANS